MEEIENILETITADKIQDSYNTMQQAGELVQNTVLPFADIISKNPTPWIIGIITIATIITIVLKRKGR